MSVIQIKRVYEAAEPADGFRIMVDRLWPRGVAKEELQFDEWRKNIAPSPESRKDFGHNPAKMDYFRARYRHELENNPTSPEFVTIVEDKLKTGNVTLLYAAKSETVNHAIILCEWLMEQLATRK